MTRENIKNQMIKLWKQVFNDSDEYISLIFDNYFDENLIEFEEYDGRIIAALLAIPYEFNLSEKYVESGIIYKNNEKPILKGLYLCGLATDNKFRGRGIMKRLINRINTKAKKLGYSFTFLIPASESLINFYKNNNYLLCFKRVISRFVNNYKFIDVSKLNYNNDIEDFYVIKYDSKNINKLIIILSDLYDEIVSVENSAKDVNLIHSYKHIKNVIEENVHDEGEIYICYDVCSKLCGFTLVNFDGDKNIIIKNIYYKDAVVKKLILQKVSETHPESPITLYEFIDDNQRELIWSPIYTSDSSFGEGGNESWNKDFTFIPSAHPEIYGMMRILNISEILKFAAGVSKDLKFSILVKGENGEEDEFFSINSGEYSVFKIIRFEKDEIMLEDMKTGKSISMNKHEYSALTKNEIGEILFRNPSQEDYAGIAFGMPRVTFNMAYLLD